ncbi:hypothetical protein H5410_037065 [Solanum commersonii]|uniref:Uncharacterized protein n=1 Tax=Solanum commersonii TaxID=4109 RepID=A0A9J5Y627_SOLCO|nr:hypothetical protein H5410_037065 [Solanum commersonii]
MKTMPSYEATSDQLINKDKSHFMVPENTPSTIIELVKDITGFIQKESPINYPCCPLYIGRKIIIYYSPLVAKTFCTSNGSQNFKHHYPPSGKYSRPVSLGTK